MKILGITGPSGAGKSRLSDKFRQMNIPVIDADEVYHSLLIPPSDCLTAIRSIFGNEIFDETGALCREKLAGIVFNDKEKLKLLNKTVLPFVLDKIRYIISSLDREIVVVDAPTLIESGFDKECDAVISVLCPKEIRLQRIMTRDGITREYALERIKAQKPDSFYVERSDAVIINDADDEKITETLVPLLDKLFPELSMEEGI